MDTRFGRLGVVFVIWTSTSDDEPGSVCTRLWSAARFRSGDFAVLLMISFGLALLAVPFTALTSGDDGADGAE